MGLKNENFLRKFDKKQFMKIHIHHVHSYKHDKLVIVIVIQTFHITSTSQQQNVMIKFYGRESTFSTEICPNSKLE